MKPRPSLFGRLQAHGSPVSHGLCSNRRLGVFTKTFGLSLGLAVVGMTSQPAQAAILTWDADGANPGQIDGAGAWLGASQWWNGTTNVNWTSGDDAIFGNGGAGGAVTLASQTTANTITFNSFTGTYTLGTAANTLTVNSGITMNSGAGAVTFVSPIALGGNQNWTNNSANLLTLAAVTNTANVTPFTITVNGSGAGGTTFGGNITNGGTTGTTALTINTTGGITTLSGTNTYTGGTTLTAGTLKLSSTTALGGATGAVNINGGTIVASSSVDLANTNQWKIGGDFTVGATGNTSRIRVRKTNTVDLLNGTRTITLFQGNASVVSGNAQFGLGDGLGGTNNINSTGGAGVLRIAGGGNTTATSPGIFFIEGVLNFASGVGFTIGANTTTVIHASGGFSGNPDVTVEANGALNLSDSTGTAASKSITIGSLAGAGKVVNSAAAAGTATLTIAGANSTDFSGVIQDGGYNSTTLGKVAVTINKSAGAQTLSGANTYTGLTTVSVGTLKLGAGGGDGTSGVLGTTAAGTSVTSGAVLDLNGQSVTGEALTLNGTGIGSGGALTNSSGSTGTYGGLITLGNASSIVASSGDIIVSNAGTISGSGLGLTLGGTATGSSLASIIGTGAGNLTKANAGTWTLSGANTYTGTTAISGGTLKLSGSGTLGATSSTLGAIASGAVLDLNGTNQTIGQFSGTSAGQIQNNSGAGTSVLTVSGATPASFAGIIADNNGTNTGGKVGLTLNSAGTLALSGVNTYTGNTTITAGTLQIGAGSTTGSLSTGSAVTNNATLAFNRSNTITQGTDFASVIGGTGAVTQAGSSTLVLNGANTYAGLTTVSAGTLKLGAGGGDGTSGVLGTTAAGTSVTSGAVLDLNGQSVTGEALTLNGTGIGSGGALTNSSGSTGTYGGLITLGNASSIVASSGDIIVSNAGTISGSGLGLTLGGTATGSSLASIIGTGATGTLTKAGSGTWTISGASTYGGTTTVQAGTLKNGVNDAIKSGNAVSVLTSTAGSATYDLNGFNQTVGLLTLGGATGTTTASQSFVTGSGSTLTNTGGITYSTTNTPLGAMISVATLDLNNAVQTFNIGNVSANAVDTTISSVIQNGGFAKSGAGSLSLTGANTFSGASSVTAGDVRLGNANALQNSIFTLSSTNGLTFASGIGMFNVAGLAGSSGTGLADTGSTAVTLSLGNSSTNATYTGALSGAGGVTKTGNNTQIFSGTNTYTGITTISGGTLQIGTGGAGGAISGTTSIVNNGILAFNRNATSTQGTQFGDSAAVISGSGSINVLSSTVVLNKANTYSGATNLNGGILQFSAANNIGDGSATNTISMNGGTLQSTANTYDLGVNRTITLNGAGTIQSDAGTLTISGGVTNGANLLTVQGAGNTTISGVVGNGTGGVTKLNAGTLTLSGNNTYTGNTLVSAGTLVLTGSNNNGATATTTLNGATTVLQLQANAANTAGFTTASSALGTTGSGKLVFQGSGAQSTLQLRSDSAVAFAGTTAADMSDNGTYTIDVDRLTAGTGNVLTVGSINTAGATINVTGNSTGTGSSLSTGAINGSSGSARTLTINPTAANVTVASISQSTAAGSSIVLGGTSSGNSVTGAIAGTNSALTKSGASTWTLSGASSYAGTTTVRTGSLIAGSDSLVNTNGAFGNTNTAIILGDGSTAAGGAPSLFINGSFTVGRAITVGSVANTAAYNATIGGTNTTGTSQFTGNITLNTTATTYTATLQAATGGTVDFNTGTWTTNNKAIAIGSSGNTGTVRLSNTLSTSGGVSVNFGTLDLNIANALGTGNTTPVTVNGGTLAIGGNNQTAVGTVILSSGSITGSGGVLTSNATYDVRSGSVSAILGGGVGLTKTAAGTVTLSGANAFTGNTMVSAGTLALGDALALQNSALDTTNSIAGNATNGLKTTVTTLTLGGLTGNKDLASVFTTTSGGYSDVTALTLNPGSGTRTYSGTIANGAAGMTLTKTGAGTQALTGANTYTGLTTISGGTLKTTGSGTLGSVNNGLTVNTGGTLDMAATSQGVGSLTGTGGTILNSTDSSVSTLIVGNNDATGGSYAGVIADNAGGGATGTVALVKTGSGTQTLAGTNTYTGLTAVQLGKLVVSGFINYSAVTVTGTNTTLASGTTGTIGNTVTMTSGAILAAGDVNAIGTATVTNGTTFNDGSIFSWDLNVADSSDTASATAYDKLTTGSVAGEGDATAGAIFHVVLGGSSFADNFWNASHSWSDVFTTAAVDLTQIFTTFGGAGVSADGSVTGVTGGAGQFTFNGSTLNYNFSAVPEPTSAIAGLLLGAGLLRRRRVIVGS